MASPRLQAAVEYLSTYGWALLIIAVAAVVLFYLNVFNPQPQSNCVLPAGFQCTSLYMGTNGILYATLTQTTGTPVNITAASCNKNSTLTSWITQNVLNPPSNQFQVGIGGSATLSLKCYAANTVYSAGAGSQYRGYLIINYTEDNSYLPHTIYGAITIKVS